MPRHCALLLVALLQALPTACSTDPEATEAKASRVELRCAEDDVRIVLSNVPWFARSYFPGHEHFVVEQLSADGGRVKFIRPGPELGDAKLGAVAWVFPVFGVHGGVDGRADCVARGGEPLPAEDCWRVCCQHGDGRQELLPWVTCERLGGTQRSLADCDRVANVCCKMGGTHVDGQIRLIPAGDCAMDGGVPVDPGWCMCCRPGRSDLAEVIAGRCGLNLVDDIADPMAMFVTNCCWDEPLSGSGAIYGACGEELPQPPCSDVAVGYEDHRCGEACCATDEGHAIVRAEQCPADRVVPDESCQLSPLCCALEEGEPLSMVGNTLGTVEGYIAFEPVSAGTVFFKVRQRAGSPIYFHEEQLGSSSCSVEVAAPAEGEGEGECDPPAFDISGAYNERYSCSEAGSCVDSDQEGVHSLVPRAGGEPGEYEFGEVDSDQGWSGQGRLCGNVFTWQATFTGVSMYEEEGVWTFTDRYTYTSRTTYTYIGGDGSGGECSAAGSSDVRPPAPAPIGGCP